MKIEEILAERAKTHGDYSDHATITQAIKWTMKSFNLKQTNLPGWNKLDPEQREALEMIAHKIGRILSGNNYFKDHWDDIAGYAKLVADRCDAPEPPAQS